MQTPPRFDFGPATPPAETGTTPTPPPGANPPYFPPPPYREENINVETGAPRSFSFARLLPTLITLGAFGGLALLGWFAYQEGRKPTSEAEVPVIKAESDSFKREPENPGGEEIPHMDKEVYNSFGDSDKMAAADKGKPGADANNPAEQPVDRAFLKQFAGTGGEEDGALDENRAGKESVAFGEKPTVNTGEPSVPAVPGDTVKTETIAPAAPVKPLINDSGFAAAPNTGGVDTAPEKPLMPERATPPGTAEDFREMPSVPLTTEVYQEPVKKKEVVLQDEPKKASPKKTETAKLKAEVKTTSAKPLKASDLRVQLGSFKTEADAKKEWKRLSGKHKSLLTGLSSKVEKVSIADKGTMYRLQAGPVKSRDSGRSLCKKLSDAGVGCFVAK